MELVCADNSVTVSLWSTAKVNDRFKIWPWAASCTLMPPCAARSRSVSPESTVSCSQGGAVVEVHQAVIDRVRGLRGAVDRPHHAVSAMSAVTSGSRGDVARVMTMSIKSSESECTLMALGWSVSLTFTVMVHGRSAFPRESRSTMDLLS